VQNANAGFVAGLRKVYPYYYNYNTYAKERWFGLSLVNVFVKEFQNYSAEFIVCVLLFNYNLGISVYNVGNVQYIQILSAYIN